MSTTVSANHLLGRPIRTALGLTGVTALVAIQLWSSQPPLWRTILFTLATIALCWPWLTATVKPARSFSSNSSTSAQSAWIEALLATAIMALGLASWIYATEEPYDRFRFEWSDFSLASIVLTTGRRLFLATLQQLMLQRFLRPACAEILPWRPLSTGLAASLFALFHLPSLALGFATGIGALVWISLYARSFRLMPLIASHALLASLTTSIAPERMFFDNEVGRRALESPRRYTLLGNNDLRALLRTTTSDRYFIEGFDSSPSDFVAGLYRDLLGRTARPEEILYWTEDWTPSSRVRVAKSLLVSDELDSSRDSLRHRQLDRDPMPEALELLPSDPRVASTGLSVTDTGWQWHAGDPAEILLGDHSVDPSRIYLLDLVWEAAPSFGVDVALNLRPLELIELDQEPPLWRAILEPRVIDEHGDNSLLLVDQANSAESAAARLTAVRLTPLRFPSASIVHTDDGYFLEGFSIDEPAFRWTRTSTARFIYPLRAVVDGHDYILELTAGAYGGRQPFEVLFNGLPQGQWALSEFEPQSLRITIRAQLVSELNHVTLLLPGAQSPIDDPRHLALAVTTIRLFPLATGPELAGRAPFR